ncbi:deoxyuridine 5'-triphosphate nucleotidohydrolase, mitochondrial isoform X2 [Myotis myotis]|uniref:deoxyuridine 5'-triphosphate nucleotidohydrolase, mitochondrial isoform X2 n=1 Tax=Myotis myotis TaxID=51298 RepID=UPI00174E9F9A|nr:deoxyuridine 5'-triphosphate nucleotidohydrolase, mitochondrial isoform X2 [Myotis myotis]
MISSLRSQVCFRRSVPSPSLLPSQPLGALVQGEGVWRGVPGGKFRIWAGGRAHSLALVPLRRRCPPSTPLCRAPKTRSPSPPASGPGRRRRAACGSASCGSRSTPPPPPRGPRAPRATTCTDGATVKTAAALAGWTLEHQFLSSVHLQGWSQWSALPAARERSWPQLGVLANPPTPADQMQPSCPHAYDYTIPPMEKTLVKTDIQIALPSGCYGRVAPRSGLAAKHFIDVGAGVIDEDYRGNLGVVLFNFGKEKFEVKKGDRIAQLICERIFYPEIEEVQVLDDTERGSGGFGSTGKN